MAPAARAYQRLRDVLCNRLEQPGWCDCIWLQVSQLLSVLAELHGACRDKARLLRKGTVLRLPVPLALLPPEDCHVPVLREGCRAGSGCPWRGLGLPLPYTEQLPLQGPYGLYGMD